MHTNITAIQLTACWFLLTLLALSISAIGTSWGFVVGALLLYGAIIIDLCDGEVGRYRALSMPPQKDLLDHMHGRYLDRVCHLVVTPLWPLSIAWGLFQMHGEWSILVAGVTLVCSQTVRRLMPFLENQLGAFFRPKIEAITAEDLSEVRSRVESPPSMLSRISGTIDRWLNNGKRFNFLLLASSSSDLLLSAISPAPPRILLALFLASGIANLIPLTYALVGSRWKTIMKKELDVLRAKNGQPSES